VIADFSDLPAEPNVKDPNEFCEGDAMLAGKAFLAKPVIRVSNLSVVA